MPWEHFTFYEYVVVCVGSIELHVVHVTVGSQQLDEGLPALGYKDVLHRHGLEETKAANCIVLCNKSDRRSNSNDVKKWSTKYKTESNFVSITEPVSAMQFVIP